MAVSRRRAYTNISDAIDKLSVKEYEDPFKRG